jgi:hypothetical protein
MARLVLNDEMRRVIHMARVMDDAAARMRECRRTRTCVWCDEPVAAQRTYPACEGCRDYRGVEGP